VKKGRKTALCALGGLVILISGFVLGMKVVHHVESLSGENIERAGHLEGHERDTYAGRIPGLERDPEAPKEPHPEDHEEVVRLNDAQREKLTLEVKTAGPGVLRMAIELPGEITMNEDRLAHIVPLLPGVVQEVRKRLGDTVRAGEVMAVVHSRELADAKAAYFAALERVALAQATFTREEQLWEKGITAKQEYLDAKSALSEATIERRAAEQKLRYLGISKDVMKELPSHPDEDLTRYEVTAPLDGTVVQKHITLGEKVTSDTRIFTLADLTSVWVDLSVRQKDLAYIKKGQTALVSLGFGCPDAEGTIIYVSPMAHRETRTAQARLVLPNADKRWRPGLFVRARISVREIERSLVVPNEALQRLNHEVVVFVETGKGFEPRDVSMGRSDGSHTEILSGLSPGERYVAKGGFELKAVLMTQDLDSHAGHGH